MIVLTIIGILAATCIPSIIQSTQDTELKARYKKEYSIINQVYLQAIQDNGGPLDNVPFSHPHHDFLSKLLPYLKTQTTCSDWTAFGDGSSFSGYQYSENGACFKSYSFKLLNNTVYTAGWPDDAGAVLSDGSDILIFHPNVDCTLKQNNISGALYNTNSACASVVIDVNGFAKPNEVGKDIYGMWLLKNKIEPFGTNDNVTNTCNTNSTGWGCSTTYLQQ